MRAKDYRNKAWNNLRDNYWMMLLGMIVVAVILGVLPALSILLIGTLTVGLNIYFINGTKKKDPDLMDIFDPFKDRFVETLVMGIIKNIFIFLWTLLFIIPGIIKSYSYFMTEYIMVYNKEISGLDAITESRRLMNGKKFRLFSLHFSFIGWWLLVIITFGIGLIFLMPYIKMAEAEFALEILRENGLIPEEDEEDFEIDLEIKTLYDDEETF